MTTQSSRTTGEAPLGTSIREYFDDTAAGYAAAYERESNSGYSFRVRKHRVLEMFDRPGGKVLDVGCGPGVVVEELVRGAGCEFWGIDISAEMIERARRRFADWPRVHFSVGGAETIDFPDGTFDAVLAMGLLEYLPDPRDAVAEMLRVLRPSGQLIVTLPNAHSPFRLWQRLVWQPFLRLLSRLAPGVPAVERLKHQVYHREFTLAEHRKVYEGLGVTVDDVAYYNFKPFPSPLDYIARRFQHEISSRLERHARDRAGFIGTGFILKVTKPGG